jgi:tetratricopeptide (TPR) repeat protein
MKYLLSACLLFAGAAPAFADEPTLQSARERLLKGNYDEARALYEKLAKDPKTSSAAAVGINLTLQSQGEYDKALGVLDAALKGDARNADLIARRAELLYLLGKWDDAEKAAEEAVKIKDEHFLARWVRTQVYRDRGELEKADKECRWFVRTYTARSNADNDIKDPDELLLVGLAGSENARWNNLSDQFDFILNDVYKDALKYDKSFWPAECEAGVLLLEKYNRGEALKAFNNALVINPSCAEALVGKGVAALQKMEFKDAESFAERALKINPNHPDALRLRADVYLGLGDVAKSMKELDAARKVNPRDERTLARVAACLHMQNNAKDYDALVKEVEKFDKKPAQFYFDLGERLDERRRFDDAEKAYKTAADLRPKMPGPLNSLGMLYMRMGREADARVLLEKGFKADPFNVRVKNTKMVLDHLDKYETLKTPHFELRFDPKNDAMLAKYLSAYLEDLYDDLAAKFQFKPKGPILVEVFNNHEMFSGRIVALPDLHTIGACTGRMFAMVSPNGKGVPKVFNWGRVLRHEMVHIFNLEQTNFLVPHWFTEGLAVGNEGFPRPPLWNRILKERVAANDLLNLDTVDLGFMRPRSPEEWHLAYAQSSLYVEYLKEKHGAKAVGEMLAAYRDGLDTAAALKKVCNVDKAVFEKGYREYLDGVVKSLKSKPSQKRYAASELKELKDAFEKKPDDMELGGNLVVALLDWRDNVEARKVAQKLLDKTKGKPHPKASVVMARLEHMAGNVDQEKALLEAALDKASPEPLVCQALGKLYYDAMDFAKAAETYELGRKAQPDEPEWLQLLVRVYSQTGETGKQIAVLKDLVPTDADDFERRARLARLLLEAKQFADAEKYARQAIEIDIRNAEVRETLLKALKEQGKDAEAEKLRKLFGK